MLKRKDFVPKRLQFCPNANLNLYFYNIRNLHCLHYISSVQNAAPRVEIKGSPEIYVNSGSYQVELQCLLTDVLEEPPFIFWYSDVYK